MPEVLAKAMAINMQQHIARHSVVLPAALMIMVNNSTVVWQCCCIRTH
jgi:hypothetical protein